MKFLEHLVEFLAHECGITVTEGQAQIGSIGVIGIVAGLFVWNVVAGIQEAKAEKVARAVSPLFKNIGKGN